MNNCSRTPLIRINWDCESSGYTEDPDNWIFFLKIGYFGSLRFCCCYLRYALSITPRLKFWKPKHCTVPDPITGNYKKNYCCRILDKFIRRAKPIQILGYPDNQCPDKWSSTAFSPLIWVHGRKRQVAGHNFATPCFKG